MTRSAFCWASKPVRVKMMPCRSGSLASWVPLPLMSTKTMPDKAALLTVFLVAVLVLWAVLLVECPRRSP